MCNPAAVVAVAGLFVSTASSIQQTKAQKSAAAYNTRVSENEAERSRTRATEAENARRLKTARLLSKQRSQLGAANIGLGSGSALQLQEDTITLGEADALRIRTTGESAFAASMAQSELESARGELAESQGGLNIAGGLLSGAGGIVGTGVADKWFSPNSVGNTNPFKTTSNPLGLTIGQGL